MRQGNRTSHWRYRLRLGVTTLSVVVLLLIWLFSSLAMTFDFPLASDVEVLFFGAVLGVYFSRWPIVALLMVLLPGSLLFRGLLAMLLFPTEALLVAVTFRAWDPAVVLSAIPLTVIGFALPFEMARLVWNARLDVDWFDPYRRRQYGLGKLMIGMTMIAGLLGLLRFFDQKTAVGLLSATCIAAVIGLVVLLPFTIRLMTGRYRFLWLIVFVATAAVLCFVGTSVIAESNGSMTGLAFWSAPVGVATFLTVYGLALLIMVRLGLRLEFGEADSGSLGSISTVQTAERL